MFVRSYGLFWRADEIEWFPGRGARDVFRLLGRQGRNRPGLQSSKVRSPVSSSRHTIALSRRLKRAAASTASISRSERGSTSWNGILWGRKRARSRSEVKPSRYAQWKKARNARPWLFMVDGFSGSPLMALRW